MASAGSHEDLQMGMGENPCAHAWVGSQKAPMTLGVGAERLPGAVTYSL